MAYSPPPADYIKPGRSNRWQDWANLVLAIWLFISPWVLQFGSGSTVPPPGAGGGGAPIAETSNAAWNAWVLGVIVFLVALSAIGRMEFWQEWINLLLGIWVFVAPWVLGFLQLAAASWDHWVVGALIFLISIWNLVEIRRAPAGFETAHAGNKPKQPPPGV